MFRCSSRQGQAAACTSQPSAEQWTKEGSSSPCTRLLPWHTERDLKLSHTYYFIPLKLPLRGSAGPLALLAELSPREGAAGGPAGERAAILAGARSRRGATPAGRAGQRPPRAPRSPRGNGDPAGRLLQHRRAPATASSGCSSSPQALGASPSPQGTCSPRTPASRGDSPLAPQGRGEHGSPPFLAVLGQFGLL